jgi:hypothetical protein
MCILWWFLLCLRHSLIKILNLQLQFLHYQLILLSLSNQTPYSILLILRLLSFLYLSLYWFDWFIIVFVCGYWVWSFHSKTRMDCLLCIWVLNADVYLFFWSLSSSLSCVHACHNVRCHVYVRDVLRINDWCAYTAGSNRNFYWSTSFPWARVLDV